MSPVRAWWPPCAAVACAAAACAPAGPPPVDEVAVRAVVDDVDGARLMPMVEALAAGHRDDPKLPCTLYPPAAGLPACELSNASARVLVSDTLTDLGYAVDTITLGPDDDVAHDLVAEWPGTTHADEVILVGAHYDAFYSGADDNSSGVAAMLELARVARRHRFARTIRFVAFDLEERGSAGSTRYVAAGHADDVAAAIVLETIGFASDAPGSQDDTTGVPMPDVGDFLLVVANERSAWIAQQLLAMQAPLELVRLLAVIGGGDGNFPLTAVLMRSDHAPFWLDGIPAIMLTDTANFRNPAYHEVEDTPDRLDPAFLAGATRAAAASMAALAEVAP